MILSPELEYFAYSNESVLKKINPATKLILLLCYLIINLRLSGVMFGCFFIFLIFLCLLSELPFNVLKKPILTSLILASVLFIAKLHFTKVGLPVILVIDFYPSAIPLAIVSALRVVSGLLIIIIFVGTTTLSEILSALSFFKMPEIVIEIFLIIYKYIFIINDEGLKMKTAQTLRLGYKNFRLSLESFGNLAGMMIVRSASRGAKMVDAMQIRGYRGNIYFHSPMRSLLIFDYLMILFLGVIPIGFSFL